MEKIKCLTPQEFETQPSASCYSFPTSWIILYRETIVVCSQIHTKHISTPCGQNVELLSVKSGGTYSDHWVLKV